MGGKRRRDAAAAATAAILAEGRLHCDEGDSHFKTGNFNKALRSYNKSNGLEPHGACHVPFRTSPSTPSKARGVKWTGSVRASRWASRGRGGGAVAASSGAKQPAQATQASRIISPDAQKLAEQRMAEAREAKLSLHAQEILKITRDTEFLHSFLRVNDDGGEESDSEHGDTPPPSRGTQGRRSAETTRGTQGTAEDRPGDAAEIESAPARGAATGPPTRVQRATFQQIVGESISLGALIDATASGSRRGRRARRRTIRGEEVYTDKDRAAAVQMGHRDIKQSLKMKQHQERVRALQLPEEAEPATLLALGLHEMRQRRLHIAMSFINKALQLNPEDRSALVSRSRCYLQLGQPDRALEDAETALRQDKTFIRGVFQKAEALYHLGDFEHSLMFYHRGLRLRPEMTMFRLGVQKAQEAIENTIGREHLLTAKSALRTSSARSSCTRPSSTDPGFSSVSLGVLPTAPRTDAASPKSVKKNQGSLAVDREYLEQLLKHPDLQVALRDNRTAAVSSQAESCVEYLRTRQEFWRQQKMADAAGGSPTERTPR